MVLIISQEFEFSTLEVCMWLRHFNVDYFVMAGNDKTLKVKYIDDAHIVVHDQKTGIDVNLLDYTNCWWRRTGITRANLISDERSNYAEISQDKLRGIFRQTDPVRTETRSLVDYIFNRIYINAKVNLGSPHKFSLNKLEVLDIARKIGLVTPNYRIVTNLNSLERREEELDTFVTKPIFEGIYKIRKNYNYYSYTEKLDAREFAGMDVDIFPSLRMSEIKKQFEIRSFYLAGQFYSMAIFSQNSKETKVDFRKGLSRYEPFKLPENLEDKLTLLFKQLELNTGSVDIIYTPDKEFVFLEVNPVGQFAMTSVPCNYNLHYKVAKYLKDGN